SEPSRRKAVKGEQGMAQQVGVASAAHLRSAKDRDCGSDRGILSRDSVPVPERMDGLTKVETMEKPLHSAAPEITREPTTTQACAVRRPPEPPWPLAALATPRYRA